MDVDCPLLPSFTLTLFTHAPRMPFGSAGVTIYLPFPAVRSQLTSVFPLRGLVWLSTHEQGLCNPLGSTGEAILASLLLS